MFLGLSIILHETFHLVVARALGHTVDVFYGIQFPNIYGFVSINPPPQNIMETIIIFSVGGLGAGAVFCVLWYAIEDDVSKLILCFFAVMQLTYGVMETMYGIGILEKPVLEVVPMVVGAVAFLAYNKWG